MEHYSKKIVDIIEMVESRKLLLPALQRGYVWSTMQIEKLFDSIMNDYPFGSFLFWKMNENDAEGMDCYQFTESFDEQAPFSNIDKPISKGLVRNADCVLDGQQRITSLVIGIQGTYRQRQKYRKRTNDKAYDTKTMYFNLLYSGNEQNIDDEDENLNSYKYEFKFLNDNEAKNADDKHFWIKVKNVFDWFFYKAGNSLEDKIGSKLEKMLQNIDNEKCKRELFWNGQIKSKYKKIVCKLYKKLKEEDIISYCEIKTPKDDGVNKILEIFLRVNNGGIKLKPTELLMSKLTVYWDDAKSKIPNTIKELNNNDKWNFKIENIMRYLWFIYTETAVFKLDFFSKKLVEENIIKEYVLIQESLYELKRNLELVGFNKQNISSMNSLLPIAYYLYKRIKKIGKHSLSENEKNEIRKFLLIAQLKGIFGGSSNSTLYQVKNIINENVKTGKFDFKLSWFENKDFGGRDFIIKERNIQDLLIKQKDDKMTYVILALLYPEYVKGNLQTLDIDHIHSRKTIEKTGNKEWLEVVDELPNLQFLDPSGNSKKNDIELKEWVGQGNKIKYLPENISYETADFMSCFKARKKEIAIKLKEILS